MDVGSRRLRKGATSAVAALAKESGKPLPEGFRELADRVSRTGRTPLAVSDDGRVLGIIVLQDAVKNGIREQISRIHQMGIESVMLTGDNPVTADAIAKEAGVNEVLPQATPADKLAFIKKHQANGDTVAMTGDGTEDAPAIAQADIGVAMDTGKMPAKDAADLVDLDSNPAKLVEIFAIGKHLLITRNALTAFSLGKQPDDLSDGGASGIWDSVGGLRRAECARVCLAPTNPPGRSDLPGSYSPGIYPPGSLWVEVLRSTGLAMAQPHRSELCHVWPAGADTGLVDAGQGPGPPAHFVVNRRLLRERLLRVAQPLPRHRDRYGRAPGRQDNWSDHGAPP